MVMAAYYTSYGSGRKPHFARWCFAMALFSAAVYSFFVYVSWHWQRLGMPDLPRLFGVSFIDYAQGFAPIYSPLFCGVLLTLLSGKLKARLSPEWEPLDMKRLIRLGVMAGHAMLSLPINWYIEAYKAERTLNMLKELREKGALSSIQTHLQFFS